MHFSVVWGQFCLCSSLVPCFQALCANSLLTHTVVMAHCCINQHTFCHWSVKKGSLFPVMANGCHKLCMWNSYSDFCFFGWWMWNHCFLFCFVFFFFSQKCKLFLAYVKNNYTKRNYCCGLFIWGNLVSSVELISILQLILLCLYSSSFQQQQKTLVVWICTEWIRKYIWM